jgi:hypothetical protein
MISIVRSRVAKRGEPGYGTLYGMISEKSLAAFSKSEIVERLRPLVQRGEVPPLVLAQVDSGLPVTVLRMLGYSDEAIAKSEAAALRQISGSDQLATAVSDLAKGQPGPRPGRTVKVDADEYARLKRIESIVRTFLDSPRS